MIKISIDTGKLTNDLVKTCEKFYAACNICISTGNPKRMKKIYVMHIMTAYYRLVINFNQESKADFLTICVNVIS